MSRSLFSHPRHRTEIPRDPAGVEDGAGRRLLAADGVVVWAEHRPRRGSADRDLGIVLVHGFTQSSTSPRVRQIAHWLADHAGVVLVDLRGHGRSGGRSSVGWHEVHDVEAAVRWARALGYRRVASLGFSLGSAVVIRQAALFGGVDAVVAVSGPGQWYYRGSANMRRLHRFVLTAPGRAVLRATRGTRVSNRPWVAPLPLDPPAAAAMVGVPLLVVHGDRDDYFPAHHAWQVHTAAPRSTLWIEQGFGHAESAVTAPLAARIGEWLTLACDDSAEER